MKSSDRFRWPARLARITTGNSGLWPYGSSADERFPRSPPTRALPLRGLLPPPGDIATPRNSGRWRFFPFQRPGPDPGSFEDWPRSALRPAQEREFNALARARSSAMVPKSGGIPPVVETAEERKGFGKSVFLPYYFLEIIKRPAGGNNKEISSSEYPKRKERRARPGRSGPTDRLWLQAAE